jgi:phosphatidylglycerophosphatase A
MMDRSDPAPQAEARFAALAKLVATAGGAGYSPVAPGTMGTLVAVPLALATAAWPLWLYGTLCCTIIAAGVVSASAADRAWGTHDSNRIVIDEVAGYLVTVAVANRASWLALALGFVIFRALDVIKPPPARWLDRNLAGGLGVVMDDVAAGVQGALLMLLLAASGVLDAVARWPG